MDGWRNWRRMHGENKRWRNWRKCRNRENDWLMDGDIRWRFRWRNCRNGWLRRWMNGRVGMDGCVEDGEWVRVDGQNDAEMAARTDMRWSWGRDVGQKPTLAPMSRLRARSLLTWDSAMSARSSASSSSCCTLRNLARLELACSSCRVRQWPSWQLSCHLSIHRSKHPSSHPPRLFLSTQRAFI